MEWDFASATAFNVLKIIPYVRKYPTTHRPYRRLALINKSGLFRKAPETGGAQSTGVRAPRHSALPFAAAPNRPYRAAVAAASVAVDASARSH